MSPDFLLPDAAAEFILRLARQSGTRGDEAAVILAGRAEGDTIVLDRVFVPRQIAFRSGHGCGLVIDGGCLNRAGPVIRESGRRFHGILHSHPEEAYHSPTDEAAVLMRFHGAFSLVIPDFGQRKQLLQDGTAFVFDYAAGWHEVEPSELVTISTGHPFKVIYDD